jgi:hypothetical protein
MGWKIVPWVFLTTWRTAVYSLFRCKQKNPYPDVYREWCACPVALAYREEPLPVAFVGGAGYSIMRSAFIFSFS